MYVKRCWLNKHDIIDLGEEAVAWIRGTWIVKHLCLTVNETINSLVELYLILIVTVDHSFATLTEDACSLL